MAGLARSIELFNSAYKLAWEHISKHAEMNHPDIAQALGRSIHDQIKVGATDAAAIAAKVVRNLMER
jgi:hypothetical protein